MKRIAAATAFFAVLLSLFLPTAVNAAADEVTAPQVDAQGAILIEVQSRGTVFEKNSRERLPMASTTKIMTALVAIENGELDETVKIPDIAAGVEGSSIYLKPGEELTLRQLLYAVLLESANDAATAVAVTVGGSVEEFAHMMNERAEALGLSDTHFTNPHGLDDEEHYTTASDLALIAAAALENETFAEIVSTYKTTIPGSDYPRLLVNHNRLLKMYGGAIGVKTGYTKRCGRCLVSAAERDGVRMIAVTLSDPSDWKDHAAMLDYGFSLYSGYTVCDEDGLSFDIPCSGGDRDCVRAVTRQSCTVTALKNKRMTMTVEARRFLLAPVREGDYVGRVIVRIDGKEAASLDLYAAEDCRERRGSTDLFDKIFN